DPRNLVSDPAALDEVTRFVFNIVCYLNWPDKDVERRLSDRRAHDRVTAARSRKARETIEARAMKGGARWIEFCGYRSERADAAGYGGTIGAHWRRGHWRNHRY